jgi:glycosyltransferase involved in cell wall biosynthesis
MNNIDIVCPVYREAATIELFHNALRRATELMPTDINFHYIYILDPSNDGTEEKLRVFAEEDLNVSVIVMSRRFGHQAALVAGLDASRGDAVVMLDSDMQHPPSLIPELIREWQSGADIVQALRQDADQDRIRTRLFSRMFYRLFESFSKIEIGAGAADFRLMSRKVVEVFREQLREQNPFLRGLISWVGFKIVYVPFKPGKRLGGQSNYSVSALMLFAANGLCSFSKLPLRVCIMLGFILSALSFFGGLLNVIAYLAFGPEYQPGWASLFAFLTFGVGVNLFFLGVLGEYVGLIFDEVKQRPRYLIDGIHGQLERSATPAITRQQVFQS